MPVITKKTQKTLKKLTSYNKFLQWSQRLEKTLSKKLFGCWKLLFSGNRLIAREGHSQLMFDARSKVGNGKNWDNLGTCWTEIAKGRNSTPLRHSHLTVSPLFCFVCWQQFLKLIHTIQKRWSFRFKKALKFREQWISSISSPKFQNPPNQKRKSAYWCLFMNLR